MVRFFEFYGPNWPYYVIEGLLYAVSILILVKAYKLGVSYLERRDESAATVPEWVIKGLMILAGILLVNILALAANVLMTEYLLA